MRAITTRLIAKRAKRENIARRTAQQLVVYRRRPGGQSQFSALLEMERPEGRFGPLLAWARERLIEPLSVEQLAERSAMSPRNFARRFAEETGLTPARAVERLRVEAAREWVEAGQEPVDQIALRAGFGDAERMRQRPATARSASHPRLCAVPRGLRAYPGKWTRFSGICSCTRQTIDRHDCR
jgi:transcriptional regulator GlxA family with amidase domain